MKIDLAFVDEFMSVFKFRRINMSKKIECFVCTSCGWVGIKEEVVTRDNKGGKLDEPECPECNLPTIVKG
jgi:hypothetical protein